MICDKCESLFCKCFMHIHKRQPAGKSYKLLKDDHAPHSDKQTLEEKREYDRLYYQRTKHLKKVKDHEGR